VWHTIKLWSSGVSSSLHTQHLFDTTSNTYISTIQEKSDIVGSSLCNISNTENYTDEFIQWKSNFDTDSDLLQTEFDDSVLNAKFSILELDGALVTTKKSTSWVPAIIPYDFLKYLNPPRISIVIILF